MGTDVNNPDIIESEYMVAGDALCALEGQDFFNFLPIIDDLSWSSATNSVVPPELTPKFTKD